jgi:hypothetical protein
MIISLFRFGYTTINMEVNMPERDYTLVFAA